MQKQKIVCWRVQIVCWRIQIVCWRPQEIETPQKMQKGIVQERKIKESTQREMLQEEEEEVKAVRNLKK